MSSQAVDRVHPILDFARRLSARLEELSAVPAWSMSDVEQRDALVMLTKAGNQLDALRLRVLAEADRCGATDAVGAGSAADWVAVATRQVRREARAELRLAKGFEDHPALAAGCEAGSVNLAQARAIATAIDRLPTAGEFAVTAEQRRLAEEHMVGLAAHHDAKELAVLGRKLFEVIAPDLADAYEGKRLEEEEAKALRRVWLSMREDDAGTVHGRFRIPSRHAQLLMAMLDAIANPGREPNKGGEQNQGGEQNSEGEQNGDAARDQRVDADTNGGAEADGGAEATPKRCDPASVVYGLALCELLERIPGKALPRHGGILQVVVLLDYDKLISGIGAAALSTGGHISAGEARRLACRHGLIPAVLDGKSRVLDVGRKRRFLTDAMLLALTIEQRHCTAEGCDIPAAMCHGHHEIAWSRGGPTSVKNGRLLCGHHHRRIHDQKYDTTHHPNGKVSFHRRT